MDNRKFCASFSVKIGTKRSRFELSPAPLHGGPEGLYRVRINRRWLDDAQGKARFLNRSMLADILVEAALGSLQPAPPMPDLPVKSRVSVRYWQSGMPMYAGVWTSTPPILAHDGRWMVAAFIFGKGMLFVPCDDVIPEKPRRRCP